MRIGVFGAGGRMGQEVCRAVIDAPDLELVAAVDPHYAGLDLQQVARVRNPGLQVAPDANELTRAHADVAIDFTRLDAAMSNLRWCATAGVHAVVGTSGFGSDQLGELGRLFGGDGANCIVAPNFAIGAVLMMRFAEIAAPFFDTAEVIELHHDNKVDAPSGTVMSTAERMAAARRRSDAGPWAPDPTSEEVLPGARGGAADDGIRIHSLRVRGMVAHQEVVLGTTGQTLTVRHDTYDRSSFMPGVLLAARAVASRPGLTLGLDAVLGLAP